MDRVQVVMRGCSKYVGVLILYVLDPGHLHANCAASYTAYNFSLVPRPKQPQRGSLAVSLVATVQFACNRPGTRKTGK